MAETSLELYIRVHAFGRHGYPEKRTIHSSYICFISSWHAFCGNQTHCLGIASIMLVWL